MLPGKPSNCSQYHLMSRASELTEKAEKVSGDRCSRYLPVAKLHKQIAMDILHPSECLWQKRHTDVPAALLKMSFKESFLLFLEEHKY